MTDPKLKDRSRYVQRMFGRIAPRYDLMNRVMTAGMDIRLRKIVVKKAQLPSAGTLLDIATGTGDIAFEAREQYPQAHIYASDFSLAMMQTGQKKAAKPLKFFAADALDIPFPAQSCDAVVSGFLLRNVVDLDRSLQEQFRILKPGGMLVSLDTTQPRKSILSPLISIYTHFIIPLLGRVLTGDREAYNYLPSSTDHFYTAEEIANKLKANGFSAVGFELKMFQTVAIHWALKPSSK